MKKYTYITKRKPIFAITQDWLNDFGWQGWRLVARRDFNQYIFIKEIT